MTALSARPGTRPPHPFSGSRYAGFLVAMVLALVLITVLAVCIGAADVAAADVVGVVWAHVPGTDWTVDPILDRIVWDLRLPRVVLACVAGTGLALAGAVLQAVVRNPIADPYVLGVGAGASLGAVLVMSVGAGAAVVGVPTAAFLGALAALAAVLVLGRRAGTLVPVRMVLSGVAIGYLLSAATSYVQLRTDPTQLSGVLFWLLGSVSGASWSELAVPLVAVAAGTAVLFAYARPLNALSLGDESAATVGVDVRRTRWILLVVASLLTGVVVAVAGGIGFVGLLVPHAVRLLVGADHRRLLPASALTGAVFLVAVDLAARTLDAPNELPLGIITAVLGAPFFLWLMRREAGPE
ncbi:FecCD family ABC transporter permease [Rhodococcus triatomae]|nr:ABC transporter permease [Rhodococcus triatomae BKS 15-14]